jgi:CheY-like chemotaxis protein
MNRILNVTETPKGTVVLVDDDKDEHTLFRLAMQELGLKNKMRSFYNGEEAFKYLQETQDDIFLIVSDLNMPQMDGLQLKRLIDQTPELKVAAIPFIFHSNSGSDAEIRTAYSLNIQGYFKKAMDQASTVQSLLRIVAFWTNCVHPKDLNRSEKKLKQKY